MKKVICVMGPTASGKSKLAIELAKKFNTEVINGDSVSIYKELNIGSAKVSKEESEGIKHNLIDVVSVKEEYSVYNFQKDARVFIQKLDIPIIVGGSGLYIKSALYDYEFNELVKRDLSVPFEKMIEVIKQSDPNIDIDFSNLRRVQSAYNQVINGENRTEKNAGNKPIYDIFLIYLDVDREVLRQRVSKRLDIMLQNGFIEETKALMEYDLNVIGYKELQSYLKGELTLEEAKDKIITSTMRFAKRQKTWFLNQMSPKIYDASSKDLVDEVYKDTLLFLEG